MSGTTVHDILFLVYKTGRQDYIRVLLYAFFHDGTMM